ncbi:MAG: osmotically inducible protein C [Myxococcales bacterium]|nr:MAG: osmotically inducible protein C [Myxococcales bacterium]
MLEIRAELKGGVKVNAYIAGHEIKTDQKPEDGGENTAPDPFQYFLASLAACTGYYVAKFCLTRDIPTDGIRVVQRVIPDPTGYVDTLEVDIELPASFPEKYREAVLKAGSQCMVKKTLENPPEIVVQTVVR